MLYLSIFYNHIDDKIIDIFSIIQQHFMNIHLIIDYDII